MRTIIAMAAAAVLLAGCGGPTAAQREHLAATQAVVDQRVRSGRMTEAEGRLAIARVKAEQDAEWRRNYAIMTSGDGPAVFQPVGGGTYIRY